MFITWFALPSICNIQNSVCFGNTTRRSTCTLVCRAKRRLCVLRHNCCNLMFQFKIFDLISGAVALCVGQISQTSGFQNHWATVLNKSAHQFSCSPPGELWVAWWRAWRRTKILSPTRTAASAKMNSSRDKTAAAYRRGPRHPVSIERKPAASIHRSHRKQQHLLLFARVVGIQLQCSAC